MKIIFPGYAVCAALILSGPVAVCPPGARLTYAGGVGTQVRYAKGNLTVRAVDTPLTSLLASITEATGIKVFLSTELRHATVSARVVDRELEEGLKSVLRGLNYAVIYRKKGDAWEISALKIYPPGKHGGPLMAIGNGKKGPFVSAGKKPAKRVRFYPGDETAAFGRPGDGGLIAPARTTAADPSNTDRRIQTDTPWFQIQMEQERRESQKYRELTLLKQKLGATRDPDRKAALSMAYAEAVNKFYAMKKAHLNKIEALKRIYRNKETNR